MLLALRQIEKQIIKSIKNTIDFKGASNFNLNVENTHCK
jgi:hypothetical protein